jgi:low temperature requirement protein LtrA
MSDRTRHGVVLMRGRDPHEENRAATPLELLFDLTFVIAFGVAADQLTHQLVTNHIGAGILGFAFATFAVSWAWINFTWFASAYDTDDWVFRLMTMVQMVGVIVLALGLPRMFHSLDGGEHVENGVMVLGYVIMRIPMLFQWLRASRQDPERRSACLVYVATISVTQAAWIVLAIAHTSIGVTFAWVVVLLLIELIGPIYAEFRRGSTPWHPHHIAERYGLMVIIALGEGLLGTTAALAALIQGDEGGWTKGVILLGLTGTAMTFGMWWIYFVVPSGPLLHAHRERSFGWGYGHIPLFGAAVAVGAGLHVAAEYLGHHTELGAVGTTLSVAVPLALYVLGIFLLYNQISRTLDPFHFVLLALSAAFLVIGVVMAAAGVPVIWCLPPLALTPWVTVVGYELVGHRHNQRVLETLADQG